jgi:integrase
MNASRPSFSINKDAHNPPKSPFWYVSFRNERGDRVRKSTGTTDEELAKKVAMEWAGIAKSGRDGRLTESQCRKVITEMYERTVGEPLHFHTTREYLTEWVESKKNETDDRTYWKYFQIAHEFLGHIGIKAERLLGEITPTDIRSWRDALKRKGLSAPTVNGAVKILRMPFKAAHDAGYIDINPCMSNLVRPLKDEARNGSKDVFTPQQIAQLIAVAESDDWKGAILCGWTTGLRLKDITDLQWSAINWQSQTLYVRTRKTRKDVVLPIHPQFAEWLEKQTRGIGKAPVFPTLAGKVSSGKSGLSTRFKGIMERAGIRGRILRQATGAGKSQSSLSFHSLRHSFNAALANAGVPVDMRQELIGHSSLEMNKLYMHPDMDSKRAAIAKLPAIPAR